jgi:lysophospholipase L1-like esterase
VGQIDRPNLVCCGGDLKGSRVKIVEQQRITFSLNSRSCRKSPRIRYTVNRGDVKLGSDLGLEQFQVQLKWDITAKRFSMKSFPAKAYKTMLRHHMKIRATRMWLALGCVTLLATGSVHAKEVPVRAFIIGDSISLQGYTKYAAETLKGEMLLHHHQGNAETTRNGLAKLDAWLAEAGGDWDIIHFNWGLWDLRSQGTHVPLAEYTANMEKLVARLKKTKATLIFATTTPVPPKNGFKRRDSDVQAYNAAAVAIMKREGIAIDDLYSFIKPTLAKHQRKNDVHFNQDGYRRMGESVVEALRAAAKPLRIPKTAGGRN